MDLPLDGKWENTSNWSLGVAPSTTESADVITNAGSKTVTMDDTTAGSFPGTMVISNLTISGVAGSTNTLSLLDTYLGGFWLQVLNQMILSNASAVVVNDSEIDVFGNLSVGASGSDNQITVTNGAALWSVASATIGGLPGFNNNVVVADLSMWEVDGNLSVRNSGPGTAIRIAEGGSLLATNVFIGNTATADGNVVLVTDPGSSWDNNGALNIGGASHGAQFIVSNGAAASSASVMIGDPAGYNHSAVLTGTGSTWSVNTTIQIGNGGTNDSLTISDAASLTAAQIKVNRAVLILNGGTFSTASLIITNSGAVQYAQTYKVDNSTVSLANGTVEASSNLLVASSAGSTGVVTVTGGQLVVTNGALSIGNSGTLTSGGGVGLMTVSNCNVAVSTILLGSSAGGSGDLTVKTGGAVSFELSSAGTNTALVVNDLWLDGGLLSITNGTVFCGRAHAGSMTMSNGIADCQDIYVGYDYNGALAVLSGTMTLNSSLTVGHLAGATGQVWVSGGQLLMTSSSLPTVIGNAGAGQFAISNGTVQAPRVIVANSSTPGTLTLAGGTLITDDLRVTRPSSRVLFSSGSLNTGATSVTNGLPFTVGDGLNRATLNLQGGVHAFSDGLIISANAVLTGFGTISGTAVNSGLIASSGLISFAGPVTNYGVIVASPGNLEFLGPVVNFGLINTNAAVHFNSSPINLGAGRLLDAAADDDGDGLSNAQEALAGTDPFNSMSALRITSVTAEGNNLRVNWTTVGGHTYQLQTNAPTASGGYTNSFSDLGPLISMPGTGGSATNYLDLGGATNVPGRYYRVRLGP